MEGFSNWGAKQPKWVRSVGTTFGFEISVTPLRHTVLIAPFVLLSAAAFLFKLVSFEAAIATLLLAYSGILFVAYYWFSELQRKRRVIYGHELPRRTDAINPDLRDEVLGVCATLFVLMPVSLYVLNGVVLHYQVAPDALQIGARLSLGPDDLVSRPWLAGILELPAWCLYTVESFLRSFPGASWFLDNAEWPKFVVPTEQTPALAPGFMQVVFGGFLITYVFGLIRSVGREIREALDSLHYSHERAAAMGPILIPSLIVMIPTAKEDSVQKENAVKAIVEIARRYPASVREEQLGPKAYDDLDFVLRFALPEISDGPPSRTYLDRINLIATAICVLQLREGTKLLAARLALEEEYDRTKGRILRVAKAELSRADMEWIIAWILNRGVGPRLRGLIEGIRREWEVEDDLEAKAAA